MITPLFQNHPPVLGSPSFLKIPHHSTIPVNGSYQVFLINRNATVKLSSIKTIHVKQQRWLFHVQDHSTLHGRSCLH